LWVRMSVSCECCVLSGRGLCEELVQRSPTECGVSKWVWSWSLEKRGGQVLPRDVVPLKDEEEETCSYVQELNEVKLLFYTMLPYLGSSVAFWKVPRLFQFVLLVRAICISRWVSSISVMILTGKNKVLGEKPIPVPLCPPQISHGVAWDRNRFSAVTDR
jgi:hypothetical protein